MGKDAFLLILAGIGLVLLISFVLGIVGSIFVCVLKFVFPIILVIVLAKCLTRHFDNKNSRRERY